MVPVEKAPGQDLEKRGFSTKVLFKKCLNFPYGPCGESVGPRIGFFISNQNPYCFVFLLFLRRAGANLTLVRP